MKKNNLVERRKQHDEMIQRSGLGPATKGTMVRTASGKTACYIRPGSQKK